MNKTKINECLLQDFFVYKFEDVEDPKDIDFIAENKYFEDIIGADETILGACASYGAHMYVFLEEAKKENILNYIYDDDIPTPPVSQNYLKLLQEGKIIDSVNKDCNEICRLNRFEE
jgi:hypothetical protein